MAKECVFNKDELYKIFQISDNVYNDRLTCSDAKRKLVKDIGHHSEGSFKMYITNYKKLCEGIPFSRNMSAKILEVFLDGIDIRYGKHVLIKALCSTQEYLIKYYLRTGTRQHQVLKVANRVAEKNDINIDFTSDIFIDAMQENDDNYLKNINIKIQSYCIENKHFVSKPKRMEKISYQYSRDHRTSIIALYNAEHKCEICSEHQTFIRKTNQKPYTEPHHLVPMKYQRKFLPNSLDVENNIVSLCSNCHNKLHYGRDFQDDLFKLYNDRKQLLLNAGIGITFEELLKMYK